MRKKAIGGIIVGVLVILICLVFIFTKNNNSQVRQQNSKSQVGIEIKKNKHRNSVSVTKINNDQDNKYTTDQWMLMGYMAYAYDNYVHSRHVSSNAEMVTDVKEDLDTGDLKASRESTNSYTLTNKFGSVGVTVQTDTVKVTGDGETITAKSELKNKFGTYADKIKAMTQNIGKTEGNKDKSISSNTQIPNFSVKQLAILAGFARGGKDWVKGCIKNTNKLKDNDLVGTMCMGYNSKNDNYYIDGHGDGTTVVTFKQEGNMLVTKHNDLTGDSVGSSPMVTKRIPLQQLVSKYYSTEAEKQEVDTLAKELLDKKQYDAKVKSLSN